MKHVNGNSDIERRVQLWVPGGSSPTRTLHPFWGKPTYMLRVVLSIKVGAYATRRTSSMV
jgi:hypothetical protein